MGDGWQAEAVLRHCGGDSAGRGRDWEATQTVCHGCIPLLPGTSCSSSHPASSRHLPAHHSTPFTPLQAGQQGTQHRIEYADGEVHWHNLASETWRLLPPKQPRSQTARASLAAIRERHNLPPAVPLPAARPPAVQPVATPAAAAPAARARDPRRGQATPAAPLEAPVPVPGAVVQLAALAGQAAQRAVGEAVQAFAVATAADGDSMLLPFRRLLRARPDCQPLQVRWEGQGRWLVA